MQNRVPVVRSKADKAALTAFTPVPRQKVRHDGWTPERQRAFIAALADTGSVTRAAGMVNMAQANCYTLRRAPGAESFAAAWDAALDFGLARLKDIAFERAIDGQLVPRFAGGKLVGFQRKRNDALLMFCLRHYGRDASGQRRTVDQFRARATLRQAQGEREMSEAEVEVSLEQKAAHPRRGQEAATRPSLGGGDLAAFEGVALDAAARAEIEAALLACAERERGLDALWRGGPATQRRAIAEDASAVFINAPEYDSERAAIVQQPYNDAFEDPWLITAPVDADFKPCEPRWTELGVDAEIGPEIAPVKRPRRKRGSAAKL